MSIEFTNCVNDKMAGRPGLILNWTSGLMRFYPWFMRVSLVLNRLLQ